MIVNGVNDANLNGAKMDSFFLLNNDLGLLRTPMEEETNGYLLTTGNYTRTLSSIIN